MAQAPAETEVTSQSHEHAGDRSQLVHPTVQAPPVTPGKVALWLFLGTEVMFFTGLIGSYVVLRSGSGEREYSNTFAPATVGRLVDPEDFRPVVLHSAGEGAEVVAGLAEQLAASAGPNMDLDELRHAVEAVPHGVVSVPDDERAKALVETLKTSRTVVIESAGARRTVGLAERIATLSGINVEDARKAVEAAPRGGISVPNQAKARELVSAIEKARTVVVESVGPKPEEVASAIASAVGLTGEKNQKRILSRLQGEEGQPSPGPLGVVVASDEEARALASTLNNALEAKAKVEGEPEAKVEGGPEAEVGTLSFHSWPQPYDAMTNPLSIDLTAINTFILICSSVTMVLALSAIQRGYPGRMKLYLLATILIGGTFLGVQVYEYYQLMFGHHYPIGISRTGHFRPDSSLFASCFFTMTGFHGAHVAGGIIALTCLLLASLTGRYSRNNHSSVELVGLYWHFVDLVWILLFTVVYLI